MRRPALGRIHERITAVADMRYPLYVVRGDEKTLLVDAGVSLLGPRYLASLEDVLGAAPRIDYLFLTHSHYDHVGSVQYLKDRIPGMQIAAHPAVARLMGRPSVLQAMNRLSANHTEFLADGLGDENLSVLPFEVDIALKEGDEFDLGGLTCCVHETPGHTRDSLTFRLPEIGAIFPGEACGLPEGEMRGSVLVSFLSSFSDYLESLERIQSLEARMICLAHAWVLDGNDAGEFLRRSIASTSRHRELIESYVDAADGDIDTAIREMARAEYDVKGGIKQERAAYLTNLSAQVRHVADSRLRATEHSLSPSPSECSNAVDSAGRAS